jgi:hypothetical protein
VSSVEMHPLTARRCTQNGSKIRVAPHLCDFVTFVVAWTLADLAGRTSPGRNVTTGGQRPSGTVGG